MKVVVTGMGALTPLGNSVPAMMSGLYEGRTGVVSQPEWKQYVGLKSHVGAAVPDYDVSLLPRTVRRTMSRMSEMAALATFEALKQANLMNGMTPAASIHSPRVLICMGSTSGSPWTLEAYFKKLFERHGPEGQVSTSFFKVMNHSVAANVAAALGFNGALLAPGAACATSTQAIIVGWEMIRSGMYDVVIAGGADELHYMTAAIFDIVQAASTQHNADPAMASRPFHRNRDGLVVAEGAGVVIMESEAHALKRGARPLATVSGGAYLCDGSHMSQSSSETMVKTIHEALNRSGMSTHDISYINAHATATLHGDEAECRSIGEVFGMNTPVSSLKGHLGHTLAACGALEAIASIEMMASGRLIPTRDLDDLDPACNTVQHVQEVRSASLSSVLSNNFAFGGMNTSLILSK